MKSLKNKVTIGMETELSGFRGLLREERMTKRGKGIVDHAFSMAISILGHLSRKHCPGSLVSRRLKTVGELYTLTEYEIRYNFRNYGKKHGKD